MRGGEVGGENSVGFSLLGFCCTVCVLSVGHVLRGMLSRRYALGTKFTLYAYKLYARVRACVRACVCVCVRVRAHSCLCVFQFSPLPVKFLYTCTLQL